MHFFKKATVFITAAALSMALVLPAFAASYTVVRNDTVYSIGQTFNTSTGTIMKSNNLSNSVIYPGQKLTVPGTDYTVKSGDTLYLIAKRAGISLTSLRKANNKWDNMLYAGEKLIIPNTAASTGTAVKGTVTYTPYELDLLARLIEAEAGSEPHSAKVGVGAVVVNRVKDSRFPNTISGVIYQKDGYYYQFTPVENGWINKPASADSKAAALEALNGSDPTHGAIYYFDDSATNRWLWSRSIALRVDKMVYTY